MKQSRSLQDPFSSCESQPLLSPQLSPSVDSRNIFQSTRKFLESCTGGLSESAIAIVFFHAVVGASNAAMLNGSIWLGYNASSLSLIVVLLYLFIAITTLFFPVSGFWQTCVSVALGLSRRESILCLVLSCFFL